MMGGGGGFGGGAPRGVWSWGGERAGCCVGQGVRREGAVWVRVLRGAGFAAWGRVCVGQGVRGASCSPALIAGPYESTGCCKAASLGQGLCFGKDAAGGREQLQVVFLSPRSVLLTLSLNCAKWHCQQSTLRNG